MFKITRGRGFHITFNNGYTVSVQFGYGNCTEDVELDGFDNESELIEKGKYPKACLAETAIINKRGDLIDYKGDCVQGYQTPEDVLKALNYAANLK